MVERTNEGPVARMGGGLAGLDLDSFDFTIFLLIMLPIAQEFHVPLTDVTFVFTITLWWGPAGSAARQHSRKPPVS
jgi:hypothetical protein